MANRLRRYALLSMAAAATVAIGSTEHITSSLAAAGGPGIRFQVRFPPLSPDAPPDIPVFNGAQAASITEAATFAWQEFIALNWPAPMEGPRYARGKPDRVAHFGDDMTSLERPVVWETLRGKVETFPGVGNPPGYDPGAPDYGFDHEPQYFYGQRAQHEEIFNNQRTEVQENPGGTQAPVPACDPADNGATTSLINLDEINQIADDSMFAGVVSNTPQPDNAQPNLIRYLAKGNQVFFSYVASQDSWYKGLSFLQRQANFAFAVSHSLYPPAQPTFEFPPGTILVKAAWRRLASSENEADFHVKTVRYYEKGADNHACWRQGKWALIGLHIINKTKTAPYFIYATFEHDDNILTSDGTPVEDENGAPNPDNPHPPAQVTTPKLDYFDADGKYYGPDQPKGTTSVPMPPLPFGAQAPVVFASGQKGCPVENSSAPDKRIFYRNLLYSDKNATTPLAKTPSAAVCVDRRYFQTPPQIVAVNRAAHAAIQRYGAQGPWQHYKLVSVQWQPFDVQDISTTDDRRLASIFYQANSVIETDNGLQQFFGNPVYSHANRFYDKSYYTNGEVASGSANNVFLKPDSGSTIKTFVPYNMGGCMGCHGNAQKSGNDFSFTLSGGPVSSPEFPVPGNPAVGLDSRRTANLHYITPPTTGKKP